MQCSRSAEYPSAAGGRGRRHAQRRAAYSLSERNAPGKLAPDAARQLRHQVGPHRRQHRPLVARQLAVGSVNVNLRLKTLMAGGYLVASMSLGFGAAGDVRLIQALKGKDAVTVRAL